MNIPDNYENPIEGKTYISPSLESFGNKNVRIRIASKVLESDESFAFATIKDELIIRQKEGSKTHIKAKFIEDSRRIFLLSFQGYTTATEKPHNASFSFVGKEIERVLEFIINIQSAVLKTRGSINITDEDLKKLRVSNIQARKLLEDNEEIFTEILKSTVTKEDIVAIGYRKSKLKLFEKLLNDEDYFNSIATKNNCSNGNGLAKIF